MMVERMAEARPRLEILLPVWGTRYVEICLAGAVSSLLAPRNLPLLAESCDVTLVFLTRREDEPAIRRHATIARWQELAGLDFIPIDDLIAGDAYGVTITLSFARAILRHGSAMTDRHFMLMASDFVLADGSLAECGEFIRAGRSAIFGPSWRAVDEEIASALAQRRDGNGITAIPPRELAALALAHPHPSVLAGMADGGLLSSAHYNQFYWPVGEEGMLARQMLMHLFCIRPERPISKFDSFFDYGLFQACCPSGDHVVLGDSDRFMVLERQGMMAELGRVRWGKTRIAAIATDVGAWTTPVHRLLGKYDCILHAHDVADEVAAVVARAEAFMEELYARLPPPLSPEGHPFWQGAVHYWTEKRRDEGKPAELGEFGLFPNVGEGGARKRRAAEWVFGKAPNFSMLHPRWAEYRPIKAVMRLALPGRRRVLVCSARPEILARLTNDNASFIDFARLTGAGALEPADLVVLDLGAEQVEDLELMIASLRDRLPNTSEIIIILRRPREGSLPSSARMQIQLARWLIVNGAYCREIEGGGQAANDLALDFARRMGANMSLARGWKLASSLGGLAMSAIAAFGSNLLEWRQTRCQLPIGASRVAVLRLTLEARRGRSCTDE